VVACELWWPSGSTGFGTWERGTMKPHMKMLLTAPSVSSLLSREV
jgi:hypothetical protein